MLMHQQQPAEHGRYQWWRMTTASPIKNTKALSTPVTQSEDFGRACSKRSVDMGAKASTSESTEESANTSINVADDSKEFSDESDSSQGHKECERLLSWKTDDSETIRNSLSNATEVGSSLSQLRDPSDADHKSKATDCEYPEVSTQERVFSEGESLLKTERPSIRKWISGTATHFLDPDSWNPRPSARECFSENVNYCRLHSSVIWSSLQKSSDCTDSPRIATISSGKDIKNDGDTSLMSDNDLGETRTEERPRKINPSRSNADSDKCTSHLSETYQNTESLDTNSVFSKLQLSIEGEILNWFTGVGSAGVACIKESYYQTQSEMKFWFRPIVNPAGNVSGEALLSSQVESPVQNTIEGKSPLAQVSGTSKSDFARTPTRKLVRRRASRGTLRDSLELKSNFEPRHGCPGFRIHSDEKENEFRPTSKLQQRGKMYSARDALQASGAQNLKTAKCLSIGEFQF